jgi:glyoxylase-like metal-dependent hydrolase (beta-lactamase superfamily II)
MSEILAVRYAHNAKQHFSENFFGGDPHDGPMPFFVWVLKGGGQAIVIDTGFDADMAARRLRKLTRPVAEGLKAAGVDLAEVKDVVLTQMHYDHAGNHDIFPIYPNARYHVQDREMEYGTGRCMCHATLARWSGGYRPPRRRAIEIGRRGFRYGKRQTSRGVHARRHVQGGDVPKGRSARRS